MKILLGTAALHPVNTAAPVAKWCNYWSLLLKILIVLVIFIGFKVFEKD